ncbi:pyridoxamine 5'-phosphate oxidase family protein [Roseivirga sp. BDSF3-8]|uniref:pyridoxamine 5'-phosphate oxidase family protein n=1 Tax=Roseivirga sp. BDSF3-8 TaxID=3241598 RepID=UPI0035319F78
MSLHKEHIDKVRELTDKIDICMMVTREPDGNLRSRPMSTRTIDDSGLFWFFTNELSDKVQELEAYPVVNLAYSEPDKNRYVSVTGVAGIVTEKTKIKELWTDALKAWFPDGLDDPRLALVKVLPDEAEYWDGSSSKMVRLFKLGKALVIGNRYEAGENNKVDF